MNKIYRQTKGDDAGIDILYDYVTLKIKFLKFDFGNNFHNFLIAEIKLPYFSSKGVDIENYNDYISEIIINDVLEKMRYREFYNG